MVLFKRAGGGVTDACYSFEVIVLSLPERYKKLRLEAHIQSYYNTLNHNTIVFFISLINNITETVLL